MTANSRIELLQSIRPEYQGSTLKRKTELLDGFVTATGYNRKYALSLLKDGPPAPARQRQRPKTYDENVTAALICCWEAANYICAQRLVPFLPALVGCLQRCGRLQLENDTLAKLLKISTSTAERILKRERKQGQKSPALTKAGNLLRKHIEIRTFADWNEKKPGFIEADTVGHHGGNIRGAYIHSLTLTDIATGWTEVVPLLHKTEHEALEGFKKVRSSLPFPLLGIDTDNGSEFMNYALIDWCEKEGITFTRSREYRKNDQCYVEEKNGSVVRKLLGHSRYEGMRAWQLISELYKLSRIYINFFQPSVKLHLKSREGARVKRKYDKARTPYQRLLDFEVSHQMREHLRNEYETSDPVLLLARINSLQYKLMPLAASPDGQQPEPVMTTSEDGQTHRQPAQEVAESVGGPDAQQLAPSTSIEPDGKQLAQTTVDTASSNRPKRGRPPRQQQIATGEYKGRCERPSMLQLVIEDVFSEFLKHEPGEVLLAKNLLRCGKPNTVRVAILQLSEHGLIANCGWGKYTRIKDASALAAARADKRIRGLAVPIRNHFLSRPGEVVDLQELLTYGPSALVRSTVSRLKRHGFIEHCGLAKYRRPATIPTKNFKPLKIQKPS